MLRRPSTGMYVPELLATISSENSPDIYTYKRRLYEK